MKRLMSLGFWAFKAKRRTSYLKRFIFIRFIAVSLNAWESGSSLPLSETIGDIGRRS